MLFQVVVLDDAVVRRTLGFTTLIVATLFVEFCCMGCIVFTDLHQFISGLLLANFNARS